MNSATANFIDGIQFGVAAASKNTWQSTFKTSTYTSNASKFWSQLIESSNIYQNSNLLVACETTHCLTPRKNTPRSVLGTKGRLLWHWSQSHVFWGDFRRDRFWLKHFQINLAFLQFSKRILSVSVVDTLLGTNVFYLQRHSIKKDFLFPRWNMDSFFEGYTFCLSCLLLQIHLKFNNLD